ncbi:MAG: tetratricopeptide repeat protein, partial [Lewinella sp.]
MRKLLLSMLVLLLSVTAVMAQSGEQALKDAKKAFDNYNLTNDATKLTEAVDMAAKVMADPATNATSKALVEVGDIYAAVINNYVIARSTNVTDPASTEKLVEGAAVKAAEAFMTAVKNADPKKGKKYIKSALKGLAEVQGNISNEGIYAIQDKDFEQSMTAFKTSVMTHEFLTSNGAESALDADKLNDEKYYGGLSAILLEKFDVAEPMFLDLYKSKYSDASLYDGLYKIYEAKGDMEAAGKYLAEGRAAFPEETQLLFTEINFYLSQGRLNELTEKLGEAINKEPENTSLYATLGQVYEQLYNQENEAGNEAEASKYFDLAQKKYEEGLTKDPNASRLIYSLGAMIYNRGAAMSQELVELGNDFSKEGQKKYEALKATVDAEFEKALPYFQKAEMTDPNDLNTLIALKEMAARSDQYEVSNEFKARIETI